MTQTPVEALIIKMYGNESNHLWSGGGSCERGRYCWNKRKELQSPVAIRRICPHTRRHILDLVWMFSCYWFNFFQKEEESDAGQVHLLMECFLLNCSPNKLTQLDETQGRMWTFPPFPIHLIPSNPQTSCCLNYMSFTACLVSTIVDTLGRCFITTTLIRLL